MPLDWVKFAMFRLVNRNGIFLLTFTPEFGWNDTIQYFYEGAQIIEETEAPLLPNTTQTETKLGYDKSHVLCNALIRPHGSSSSTPRITLLVIIQVSFRNLAGKSEEEILIRAYGVCTKSHTAAFPMFNKRAHVITQAQFAAVLKAKSKDLTFPTSRSLRRPELVYDLGSLSAT
jgi:hypothetical protein